MFLGRRLLGQPAHTDERRPRCLRHYRLHWAAGRAETSPVIGIEHVGSRRAIGEFASHKGAGQPSVP